MTASSTAAACAGTRSSPTSGMMGGIGAHEYMAPCPAGRERGRAVGCRLRGERRGRDRARRPRRTSRAARRARAGRDAGRAHDRGGLGPARRRPGHAAEVAAGGEGGRHARPRAGARRPPRQPDQARRTRSARRRGPATEDEIRAAFGAEPGFIGPVGVSVEVVADDSVESGRLRGRGQRERHAPARRASPGRDFEARFADIRTVEEGDRCPQRRHDPHRARDRGRQHLQARHAVLGGAGRDVPRRGRQGAARS